MDNEISIIDNLCNDIIQHKPDYEKDYWQTPAETMKLGAGDCEDIAILKYFKLKEIGYHPHLGYAIMDNSEGHMYCLCGGIVLDCQEKHFNPVLLFNEDYIMVEGKKILAHPYSLFPQWKGIVEEMDKAR